MQTQSSESTLKKKAGGGDLEITGRFAQELVQAAKSEPEPLNIDRVHLTQAIQAESDLCEAKLLIQKAIRRLLYPHYKAAEQITSGLYKEIDNIETQVVQLHSQLEKQIDRQRKLNADHLRFC